LVYIRCKQRSEN